MPYSVQSYRCFHQYASKLGIPLSFLLLLAVILFSGCVSSQRDTYSDFPDCEGRGNVCIYPLMASMPPRIDHEILRLAIVPLTKDRAGGLPTHIIEEINAEVESSAQRLKNWFPRFTIVERGRLEPAIHELKFQASGHVREDNFVGAGRMLGADHIFTYEVNVDSTNDVSRSVPGYPNDVTEFGLEGGTIRVLTHGKVIHVETGAVVFRQTSKQSMKFRQPPSKSYWKTSAFNHYQKLLISQTISGLFASFYAALAPSPHGMFFHREKASNRVSVEFVLYGSPADLAGLQRGDIITAINGIAIRGIGDPLLSSMEKTPSQLHYYTIERKGREQTLTVRPRMRES